MSFFDLLFCVFCCFVVFLCHCRVCKFVCGFLLFGVGLWFHEKTMEKPTDKCRYHRGKSGEICGFGIWIRQFYFQCIFGMCQKIFQKRRPMNFVRLISILTLFKQTFFNDSFDTIVQSKLINILPCNTTNFQNMSISKHKHSKTHIQNQRFSSEIESMFFTRFQH